MTSFNAIHPFRGRPDPVASVLAGVPKVNRHRFLPQPAVAVVPGAAGLWLPGTASEVGIGAFMNEFSSEVNIAFWSVALIVPGPDRGPGRRAADRPELEYGTWRLAWSQTVPRACWLAVTLALVTGGFIVLGAAMTPVIM